MVVPNSQWLLRWVCMVVVGVGTLMHMVGMAAPYWLLDRARPTAYQSLLRSLRTMGVDLKPDATWENATSAATTVGLWRWCAQVSVSDDMYRACETPDVSKVPGWWKGCQAMAIVGMLMGVLACACAGMEVYYTRRGIRFSGLAVLCAISCFVAAVGMGLSHGMFATKYADRLPSIVTLDGIDSSNLNLYFYPPLLDWAFGVGAAGATLIGVTGILLVAFITRTYPAYQRTESVVV